MHSFLRKVRFNYPVRYMQLSPCCRKASVSGPSFQLSHINYLPLSSQLNTLTHKLGQFFRFSPLPKTCGSQEGLSIDKSNAMANPEPSAQRNLLAKIAMNLMGIIEWFFDTVQAFYCSLSLRVFPEGLGFVQKRTTCAYTHTGPGFSI